ncbi:hypothetical protein BGW80DRAFT_559536 [Lactifluus volemus]|nr:hypothetical protein BGW80DRAFT_559536 [Lactifluus volemus]
MVHVFMYCRINGSINSAVVELGSSFVTRRQTPLHHNWCPSSASAPEPPMVPALDHTSPESAVLLVRRSRLDGGGGPRLTHNRQSRSENLRPIPPGNPIHSFPTSRHVDFLAQQRQCQACDLSTCRACTSRDKKNVIFLM